MEVSDFWLDRPVFVTGATGLLGGWLARRLLGEDKIIGITVGALEEALEAQRDGADYLGVSPIFATQTKEDAGEAVGLERIREIRPKVALPLVGIGGINLKNARQVIEAGADCVCAISAVVGKEDVRGAVEELLRVLKGEC